MPGTVLGNGDLSTKIKHVLIEEINREIGTAIRVASGTRVTHRDSGSTLLRMRQNTPNLSSNLNPFKVATEWSHLSRNNC